MNNPETSHFGTPDDLSWESLTANVAFMTPGIAALGRDAVHRRIIKTIMVFDDFYRTQDPHEEHDVGSFEAEGRTIMFEILHYDYGLACPSAKLFDPVRVIAVRLAGEN